MDEQRQGGALLLAAGLEDAEQDALRARARRRAVAAPHLARHHHGADGLLGAPVGGLQAWAVEEGEQGVALPLEMMGQAVIADCMEGQGEQTIHARFQPPAHHRQSVRRCGADRGARAEPASTATSCAPRAESGRRGQQPQRSFPGSGAASEPGRSGERRAGTAGRRSSRLAPENPRSLGPTPPPLVQTRAQAEWRTPSPRRWRRPTSTTIVRPLSIPSRPGSRWGRRECG